ncbi:ABC transporter ATP-binding protein [Yinghuangia sp. ASG 101]|uniref:ABC transporter ATP-binding protein n=1 Tax=Yinghuangia sp. ASG 101 TaxID=2896848 RepID=UPI001E2D6C52|nr:ABC transporter ATP-binding protein [Yinghuangia sp. ASG 101]UGQ13309.1 ABC transporter ATP-binding protein [Yinghuangia sp. ASG 101]
MGLEVTGVTVRFGGHVALDNVSLHAQNGLVTGLIGPNGAGKTTMFNVITGLQAASSGTVTLDGRDVGRLAPYKRARRGMARTFQRLELFGSLTVRDNIHVAAAQYRLRHPTAESAGRTTGELIERLGLVPIADVRADSLPTGQGRMVELARALACRPRLLLLDEPASGQDESETAEFSRVLREVAAEGAAVLLVEHDMDLVMSVCDELHVLDFGRKLAQGTCAEIQADARVRAAYLGEPEASDEALGATR